MRADKIVILAMMMSLLMAPVCMARESDTSQDLQDAIGATPPRLSFVDGQVSFWRPGTEDWVDAQINTPLAPGDQLWAGPDGNLELQVGARAFVRGGAEARIILDRREPDFLEFKVSAGTVALDMRQIEPGRMVVVETPQGSFNIEDEGYYRLNVDGQGTHFTTRRTGKALVVLHNGERIPIQPNESITVPGDGGARIIARRAPSLDEWDQWNYSRTDQFLAAENSRYVPPEVYGANDLDHYGTWIVTSAYGPVWRPHGVAVGWVPYSTGAWVSDPYYGWTWVDTAPWGWAPYHYGRWVFVNSYWCWAPGPRVARPVYAPALVAFFGAPGVRVGIGVGGSAVGWVALGWGEPLVPWWGRPGFIHQPWWGGWGGPHCVNNKVIRRGAVVKASHLNVYQNMHRHDAMVVVDKNRFGHGFVAGSHVPPKDVKTFRPLHEAPRVTASHGRSAPAGHHLNPAERNARPSIGSPAPQRAIPPKNDRWQHPSQVTTSRGNGAAPAKTVPVRPKENYQRVKDSAKGESTRNSLQQRAPLQPPAKSMGASRSPDVRSVGPSQMSQPRPDASQGANTPAMREQRMAKDKADRSFLEDPQPSVGGVSHGSRQGR